jgi:hypothetical protein
MNIRQRISPQQHQIRDLAGFNRNVIRVLATASADSGFRCSTLTAVPEKIIPEWRVNRNRFGKPGLGKLKLGGVPARGPEEKGRGKRPAVSPAARPRNKKRTGTTKPQRSLTKTSQAEASALTGAE